MKKSVSVITNALFEKLPHDLPFYTQDGLVQYGLPSFLVKRISHIVYLRILENVSLPDETWLNHESDAMTDAWVDLTGAIKQELRIPSGIMKEVMKKSVQDCLELTVQPRKAIGKNLFGDDHELDVSTITERASSITVNRYLVWSLIRYMEKKKKDKIDRGQADRILEKIDAKVVENYHPLNWLALVKPLFELCGPTVPTDLLRLFFEDKKQNPVAKEFDLMNTEINESQFIEVLSSPDLLYVEGFNDDQQTLFNESLEDDLEDPLHQKFMKSTEDLPEILPIDDETDIRDDFSTEADDDPADEIESTAPWDEDEPEAETEPDQLKTESEPEDEINVGAEVDDFIEKEEKLSESSEPVQVEPEAESEPEAEDEIEAGEEVDDFIDQNENLLESFESDQDDAEEQEVLNKEEILDRDEAGDTDIEPESIAADPTQKEVTIESIEIDDDGDDELESEREVDVDMDTDKDEYKEKETDETQDTVTIESIEIDDDDSDELDQEQAENEDTEKGVVKDQGVDDDEEEEVDMDTDEEFRGVGTASPDDEDESLASRFMFDEGPEYELEEDQDLDEATTIYDELNLARKGAEPSTLDLFSNPEQVTFEKDKWLSFEPDETDDSETDDPETDDPETDDLPEPNDPEADDFETDNFETDDPEMDESNDSMKQTESESPLFVDESEFKTMNEENLDREDDELPMWRSFLEREDVENTSSFQFDNSRYDLTEEDDDDADGVVDETSRGGGTALPEDEGHVDEVDDSALDETEADADEDSELLDEDGFIEEPIYDLTKEETPIDQKIDDLNEWMLDEKETFIEEIFGDSEDAYEQALADIIEFTDWKSASRYIEKEIFTRNRIDVYDEIAVDFTDRLHSYFLENK